MTSISSKVRFLLLIACVIVCGSLFGESAQAQVAPRASGTKPVEKQPAATNRTIIRRPRRERPKADVGSAGEESDQFLDLADKFYEKGKLTAAEVAYKEALRIWARNPDAVFGLGSVYATKGLEHEAQAQLNKLRSLDSELANELAAAITKSKTGN